MKSSKSNKDKTCTQDSYTIKDIFDILYTLIDTNYSANAKEINSILSYLENSINSMDNTNMEITFNIILEFKLKIYTFFDKEKQNQIKECSTRLDYVLNTISSNDSIKDNLKNDYVKLFEYFLYKEKNLKRIKILLECNDTLIKDQIYFKEIFLKLITMFSQIDFKNKDVDYYYKVIILIISMMDIKTINKYKQEISNILCNSNNRKEKYVKNIISILKGEIKDNTSSLEEKYNVSIDYPSILEETSFSYSPKTGNRKKIYDKSIITIDSANTSRIDDGISIKSNNDGSFSLYVFITDIPSIIDKNSILDEEALKRSENIYYKDGVIPIYPDYISKGIASLLPNNKRNAITFKMDFDNQMNYIEDSFDISLNEIIVSKKMDYNEVNSRLKYNNSNNDYYDILKYLFLFAIKNLKNSDIDVEYYLCHPKELNSLIKKYGKNSELALGGLIVKQVMKNIGYRTSKFMNELELPFLYKSYNCDLLSLAEYENFISTMPSLKEDERLMFKLKRNYSKSFYTSIPKPFNGFASYAGVTDPLWKYADSYNLYMIHNYLFDNNSNYEIDFYRTKNLAKHLNQRILLNQEFKMNYDIHKTLLEKSKKLRRKK